MARQKNNVALWVNKVRQKAVEATTPKHISVKALADDIGYPRAYVAQFLIGYHSNEQMALKIKEYLNGNK